METSTQGRAFIRSHEGDVLKAYRCPAGIWTIGVGLTAGSGVVKPKAGMTITREESDRLFRQALARNYEPRVRQAMPGAKQHEFDGGASFDWNTGKIHKAGWVRLWVAKATPAKIRAGLNQWTKGGGKVLPGLKRRRIEEADIILEGEYPANLNLGVGLPLQKEDRFARFVVAMTRDEIEAVAQGFKQIGYNPGVVEGSIRRDTVETFQFKHGLKPDGLIGRATLSTLQRELDARAAIVKGTGGATAGGAIAGGNEAAAPATPDLPEVPTAPDAPLPDANLDVVGDPLVTWLGIGIAAASALFLLWLAWRYRDLIAARVAGRLPRLAEFLRSF
ncbi:MAG: peptidoglycan-binding protein [Pseudomonadota bacterium]